MAKRLDPKIRSLVTELVSSGPEPYPAAAAIHRRPRPRTTLGGGLMRMTAVAVLVVAAGLVGVWIGRGTAPWATGPAATHVIGAAQDLVDLPPTHPALQILADGYDTFDAFAEEATRRNLAHFACAESTGWQLCLLESDGILAVVPFGQHTGVAHVQANGLSGPVEVPLDIGHPVGLASSGSPWTVTVRDPQGNVIGSSSG